MTHGPWAFLTRKKAGTVYDLFCRPVIRQTTIIIITNQFVRGMIKYGFLLNIGTIGGNIFANNIWNNVTGIPGLVLHVLIMNNVIVYKLYIHILSLITPFVGHENTPLWFPTTYQ